VQDAEGCNLIDGAEVGLALVSPGDLLGHDYWPAP
jgi:hypothetical protein